MKHSITQSQLGELVWPFCLGCRVHGHGGDYKVLVYDNEGRVLAWNDYKEYFCMKESNCLMVYLKTTKRYLVSRERNNEN